MNVLNLILDTDSTKRGSNRTWQKNAVYWDYSARSPGLGHEVCRKLRLCKLIM